MSQFGDGASSSDPNTDEVSSYVKVASVISGMSTRSSSESVEKYTTSGVRSTKMAMSLISLSRVDEMHELPSASSTKIVKGQGAEPILLVTDKLRSYPPAVQEILPGVEHDTTQYANNRAELSHQPIRQRERQMRRFKSGRQAQRFLSLHARVSNLFRYGRHLLRAENHRLFRARAIALWRRMTCA